MPERFALENSLPDSPENDAENGKRTRKSPISKVFGVEPEREEEVINQFIKPFDLPEIKKSPEQVEIITNILDRIPDFVRRYGGTPVDVSPEDIHLLNRKSDDEYIKKSLNKGFGAQYDFKTRSALIFDFGSQLYNSYLTVHELLHLNSFQSIELADRRKKTFKSRRAGLQIMNVKDILFRNIEEAVIEELTMRFDKEYFKSIPGLSDEIKERERNIEILSKYYPEEKDYLEKVFYIEETREDVIIHSSYLKEREQLYELIDKIRKKYQNFKYEDIFNIFAKATMQGNLLPVARLIEGTYQKGYFRTLAEKTKVKLGEFK